MCKEADVAGAQRPQHQLNSHFLTYGVGVTGAQRPSHQPCCVEKSGKRKKRGTIDKSTPCSVDKL